MLKPLLLIAGLVSLTLPVRAQQPPAWTTTRAFLTARPYVVPPGTLLLSFDADSEFSVNDAGTSLENVNYALTLGLGRRLAIDLGMATVQHGLTDALALAGAWVGGRWAWAEWGAMWGNPTVSLGYEAINMMPPIAVARLALADGWGPGLWAIDAVFTRELRGVRSTQHYTLVAAGGLTWPDNGLDAGVEGLVTLSDDASARFSFTDGLFLAGPYVRWTPLPQASLLLGVQAGTRVSWETDVSASTPIVRPKVVIAWEL